MSLGGGEPEHRGGGVCEAGREPVPGGVGEGGRGCGYHRGAEATEPLVAGSIHPRASFSLRGRWPGMAPVLYHNQEP